MIELQTLGGVSVTTSRETHVAFRSRKHLALLVLLAGGRNRVYSRTALCDFLWTSPAARARHSLSQAVYDLSTQLGPVIKRGPGDDLSLDRSQLTYDVEVLESAIKTSDLATAVDVFGGSFADNLSGVGTTEFERWLDAERIRAARLGEMALRRFLRECEATGQWGSMCLAALKLIDLAPLDEDVHQAYMRALWFQGDAHLALRHYDEVVMQLKTELREELNSATCELVRRIRSHSTAASKVSVASRVDREPPFIGRENECAQLRHAVDNAYRGENSVIVVRGERGIGKSRLVGEFSRRIAVDPIRVLSSRCFQAEEGLPYSPIIDGLAPLVQERLAEDASVGEEFKRLALLHPDFGSVGRGGPRESEALSIWQRQLYEEVALFLAMVSKEDRIVWIVDDVQWIDRASGGLLHYLSRRLDGELLFLFTLRQVRRGDRLPALPIAMSGTSGPTIVDLGPLEEDEIRTMIGAAVRMEPGQEIPSQDLAVRLSAGNPYYALEVLEAATASTEWAESASAWDPLSDDRLREVLAARILGLGPEHLHLLQAIAVLESFARPRIVAEVAEVSVSEAAHLAEELYARGLLVDESGRVSFANDAMREYVYLGMSGLQKAALHLRAGKALEREADPSPGSLAMHFYQGDEWSKSFVYAMEAARAARQAAGHTEASHFASIAAKVAPGIEERRAALEAQAEASFAAGDLSGSATCYGEILQLPFSMADTTARISLRLAGVEIVRCRWERATRWLAEALREVGRVVDREDRLSLSALHGELALKLAFLTDDLDAARAAEGPIDLLVSQLRALDPVPPAAAFQILSTKGIQEAVTGSSRRALEALSEAEGFMRKSTQWQEYRYFAFRGYVRNRLADWDGAEADMLKALAAAEGLGELLATIRLWNNMACIATERGDWSGANQRIEEATRLQSQLSERADTSLSIALNRANLLFYQGFLSAATEQYEVAGEICRMDSILGTQIEVHSCLGLISLQRGRLEEALRHWQDVQQLRERSGTSGAAQEHFKFLWFAAWITNDFASLAKHADDERERDTPSFAKLLWLHALLNDDVSLSSEARVVLDNHDMSWFAAFSSRWRRSSATTRSSANRAKLL